MSGSDRWRRLGILLLWIAMTLLAFAVISKAWLVAGSGGGATSASLLDLQDCGRDSCHTREFDRGFEHDGWKFLGMATTATTALALLALLWLFFTTRQGSTTVLRVQVTTLLLLVALASGIGFVVEVPLGFDDLPHPAPGHAFPIFLIGILAALIAVTALRPEPGERVAQIGET